LQYKLLLKSKKKAVSTYRIWECFISNIFNIFLVSIFRMCLLSSNSPKFYHFFHHFAVSNPLDFQLISPLKVACRWNTCKNLNLLQKSICSNLLLFKIIFCLIYVVSYSRLCYFLFQTIITNIYLFIFPKISLIYSTCFSPWIDSTLNWISFLIIPVFKKNQFMFKFLLFSKIITHLIPRYL